MSFKIHELKIKHGYYVEIVVGNKNYECRLNDRDYQIGDYLHLRSIGADHNYTGDEILMRVKHILSGFEGLKENYVILTLNEVIDRSIS